MESYDSEERTGRLLQFVSELCDPQTDVKSKTSTWIDKFQEVYFDSNHERVFLYCHSRLAQYLYQEYGGSTETDTSDGISIFIENINFIIDACGSNKALSICLHELKDYVQLEDLRISQASAMIERIGNLETFKRESNSIEKDIESIKKDTKTLSDQLSEAQNEVKNHSIQIVTALSIFAGIVFAFSGGLTILGNIFSNITSIRWPSSFLFIAMVILVGLVLYNVIYLLMSFTSKICVKYRNTHHGLTIFINVVAIIAVIFLLLLYYHISPVYEWIFK